MKKTKLFGLAALLLALGVTGCGNENGNEDQSGEEDNPAECAHEYGAWTTTKEATCKAKGSKERTCSKCQNIEKEDIAIDNTAHKWVDDADSNKVATCSEAGVTGSKKCEICNEKKAGTAVAATGHNFVAEGAKDGVVQKYKCAADEQVAYVLDVADATGWNKNTTKMNGKTAPDNKSTWTITGKIPAGTYDIQIEGKMSYDTHSTRKWYNMAKTDLMVDGDAENNTGDSPDKDTEDSYRYFITVGTEVYNPQTKKSWGELGFKGGTDAEMVYGELVNGVEIKADTTEISLNHGNIGYSFICSKIRLVYNPAPVEVKWSALNDLDSSSVGIEKNSDYIRFNGTSSVRDSSGSGTGCIAVYKINSPRAVAKAELWFDAQSHSQITSLFASQSNDDVKGYVSDGAGGWKIPDYRYSVRINGQAVAFKADNEASATSTRDWYKFTLNDFALSAGQNIIEIEGTGGYRAKIYNFKLVEAK